MSDTRVIEDMHLIGICDQLSDEELDDLGACAEDGVAVPVHIIRGLTEPAADLLAGKFLTEVGRLQIVDAVEMERNERTWR